MRPLVIFGSILCLSCSEIPKSSVRVPSNSEKVKPYTSEDKIPFASSPEVVKISEKASLVIPKRDRKRKTAILIARIAINENTKPLRSVRENGTEGKPTSDHKAMLQEMVEFSRWKGVSLKRAATWQSKYVTGVKKAKVGHQHAWTSTLPAQGEAMPSGWIECPHKPVKLKKGQKKKKCHGRWELYADNWVSFREWVVRQITDGVITPECDGKPITWGGDMDDHIAIARGLCVIEGCGDLNTWWTKPGWGCDESMKGFLSRTGTKKKKSIPARLIIQGYRNAARRPM